MQLEKNRPPAFVDGMEQYFTHSPVGFDDWGLQRIKYTTEDWRHFKHEYHSKPCALLMTLLDFNLSNASIFADRIFEIIMNLCDRRTYKKNRNKQTITFKIYVIQRSKATLYCIKYKYK